MISAISIPTVQAGAWAVATSPVAWASLGALVLFIGAYYCISQARAASMAHRLTSQNTEKSKVEDALVRLLTEGAGSLDDFTAFIRFRTAKRPRELFGPDSWSPFEGAFQNLQGTTVPLVDIASNALAVAQKASAYKEEDLYSDCIALNLASRLSKMCPIDKRVDFYKACLERRPIGDWQGLPIFFKMDLATCEALIEGADFSQLESLWGGGNWLMLETIAREIIRRWKTNPSLKVSPSFQEEILRKITLDRGEFSAANNDCADKLRDIVLPQLFLFVDDWAVKLENCLLHFFWGKTGCAGQNGQPFKDMHSPSRVCARGVKHYFSNIQAMDAKGLDWKPSFQDRFFAEARYGKVTMLREHAPKHLQEPLLTAFMGLLPQVSDQDVHISQ